ncbi:MAG: amino acid-binding protein [Desulfobacterales bacterium]|jgi:hypothetical protein
MKLKQISVPIENSHTRLYELIRELDDNGINPRGLTLVDTGNLGEVRMLVSDTAKARQILMQMDMPGRIDDVVAVRIDIPDQLSDLLSRLMAAGITVNYGYALTGMESEDSTMIFRFNDNDKAIRVLRERVTRLEDRDAMEQLQAAC